MARYKNLTCGESPISTFHIAAIAIDIQFDGWIYTYDYSVTGRAAVEELKKRALAGRGLATYISTQVKERYASKRRAP